MGTSLFGLKPKNTYQALLKTTANTAIDATLRTISDGLGNDTPLQLSLRRVGVLTDTSVTTQVSSVIEATTVNSSLVIAPNGTGALVASIPDGTIVGGNARGTNSVDLQTIRTISDKVASGNKSVVVGGVNNKASGVESVVVGGAANSAQTLQSFIGGGSINTISAGSENAIVSGAVNTISGTGAYGFIGAGFQNTVSSQYSVVTGGQNNTASTNGHATVVGGQNNTSSGAFAIVGGQGNTASGNYANIGGGQTNTASGTHSTTSGGFSNTASSNFSFVGGGQSNNVFSGDHYQVIVGGLSNVIGASGHSFIGGGQGNVINTSSGSGWAVLSGGRANSVSSFYSTVSGGQSNTASTNSHATVVGGSTNASTGQYSVSGGFSNTASGSSSVALGQSNQATSTRAIAIGLSAQATNTNAVAIGNGSQATAINSFSHNATGIAYLWNSRTHGGFYFVADSDKQLTDCIASREASLTTAATTVLSLDGTGVTNLIIPRGNNRAWNVQVNWVAIVTTITGTATGITVGDVITSIDLLAFKKIGGISSASTHTSTATKLMVTTPAAYAACAINYTAGASQEMALTFTGPTFLGGGSVTMRVVANIELTEVAF